MKRRTLLNSVLGVITTLASLAVLMFSPTTAQAQVPSAEWTEIASSTPLGPRGRANMVYDKARDRLVFFGTDSTATQVETWEYDGSSWQQITTAHIPPTRGQFAMAYDDVRQRVVVFGGSDDAAGVRNDTWEYDGSDWVEVITPHAPDARREIAYGMDYDSIRQRMVLFGGCRPQPGPDSFCFDDTWEYDGIDWVQISTPTSPNKRGNHAMVFDAARGKMVLFSGFWDPSHPGTAHVNHDMWEYDGTTWTQITISLPPARGWHMMTYDPGRQRTVLFGGVIAETGMFNDTWEYDGTSWQQISTPVAPAARTGGHLAYSDSLAAVVLQGGDTLEDFWMYAPVETRLTVTPSNSVLYPGDSLSVDVNVLDAADLYAAQTACGIDPAVLELQSAVFGDFFDPVNRMVAANEISPTLGTWFGAISQQNPAGPLSGDGLYATFTFEATGLGTTTLGCDPLFSNRDGFTQTVSFTGAIITVIPYAAITGTATYQGRLDHAGIDVTATGPVTRTDTTDGNGDFAFGQLRVGAYDVRADVGSYLPSCTAITLAAGDTVALSTTRLLGGDLNDDEMINIGDATLLTGNFNETVPPADARADVNADGVVNVQDLAILAGNYEVSGCQPW